MRSFPSLRHDRALGRSSFSPLSLLPASSIALVALVGVLGTTAACSDSTTTPAVSGSDAGGGGSTSDGGSATEEDAAPPAPFALTSTAFEEGDKLPSEHTCDGANDSPPLAWTAGPEGTKSYALVFTDKTNGLVHSVIYDIPATATALPAKLDNVHASKKVDGAKQTTGYDGKTFGYLGPCPSGEHTYEFALYAISVDKLEDLDESSERDAAVTAIKAADLAVTKLTVKYERTK